MELWLAHTGAVSARNAQALGSFRPLGQHVQLLRQEEKGGLPEREGLAGDGGPALSDGRGLAVLLF